MTQERETPEANPAGQKISTSAPDQSQSDVKVEAEADVDPTLTGYFKDSRVTPSAFFKVIRKNQVKRFLSADREEAGELMRRQDRDCERLWALMSQSTPPDAVDDWIWGAAQARVKEHLKDAFDPLDHDAGRIFRSVLATISPSLSSDEKEERKRSETLLRITICWLMEKRSLRTWQVAEQLQPILFSDLKSASKAAKRAVQRGKIGELRLAVAVAGLGEQLVKVAEEDRNRERNIANDLRHRLDSTRDQVERLNAELANAKSTISDHEAEISKLEETLATERQHWGHDLTETKAEQKVLLGERLGPLLEDAIDALEIEPPAPGIALRRVKAALSAIEEAKE
ncbi:hypothetical protein [Roseibaca sp. Y0-43]|uniref:hypothetical protein n=1 Tax=Roseibaca sp. Y0-43 TaxID=2816854 RepID=UPI001D0CD5D7|nr:hypothetical protein [Roseibaca sp. Y0-43]MCC1482409.1 hypothetical protein [Roseibaca sp. Y0-43]